MTTVKKGLPRAAIATLATGALALSSASPSFAQDRRNNDRISTGEIIAGAVILGGIAAVAAATGSNNNRRSSGGYVYTSNNYRDGYREQRSRRGSPRRAVERCIRAVERDARRAGYGFADVTEIRDIERSRQGWEVRGRLIARADYRYRDNRDTRYRNNRDASYRYRTSYDDGYNSYAYRPNSAYSYAQYDERRGRNNRRVATTTGKFRCDVSRGRINNIRYKGLRLLR